MTSTNPPDTRRSDKAFGHPRMGEILIREGLITEQQLEQALEKQQEEGGKTFEILLRLGYLDKDRLHRALAKHSGIANIDLSRLSLRRDLINLIPHDMALDQLVLPIDRIGKVLTVAMACPLDTMTIFEIESLTGMRVKAMLSKLDDIVVAVEQLYREPGQHEIAPEKLGQVVTKARGEARAHVREQLAHFELQPPEFIARRITEATGDARIPLMRIGEMLERDPVALCEILDMANSVIYGIFAEIDTMPKALTVLDKQGVNALFKRYLEVKASTRREWSLLAKRAYRSAFIASALLPHTKLNLDKYGVRSAAMLCWLGRFALLELVYSKYKFINHDLVGEALCAQEREIADMTHIEAGEQLLLRAGLSEALIDVVRHYGNPKEAIQENQPLAMLANIGAHAAVWKSATNESDLEGCRPWMEALNIKTADIQAALRAYEEIAD